MKSVTIAKGERANFEIELTKGDALVRWFKDGKELQFSEHLQLAIDGKRQRLMVYNALPEDDGEYSCQVIITIPKIDSQKQ
jgi:Immunoglobulin I-set domain